MLDVAADAPSLSSCKPIEKGGNSTLFAGDGSKLGVIASDEARTPVAIEARCPKDLQQATVAIEDERFYEHGGVDEEGDRPRRGQGPRSRRSGRGRLDDHPAAGPQPLHPRPRRQPRTQDRRGEAGDEYSEAPLARSEILGQYLNTASYGTIDGSTAVGVQAASKIYFSKPVWKLDLAQSALLAGLPQAPTEYNPILNPAGARERRDEVLAKMAELGFISERRSAARRRAAASASTSPRASSSTASPTSSTTSRTS